MGRDLLCETVYNETAIDFRPGAVRKSATQCLTDPHQVMPTVAQGVVFDGENAESSARRSLARRAPCGQARHQ